MFTNSGVGFGLGGGGDGVGWILGIPHLSSSVELSGNGLVGGFL